MSKIKMTCDTCNSSESIIISAEHGIVCSKCFDDKEIPPTYACQLVTNEIQLFDANDENLAKAGLEDAGFPLEKQQDLLYVKLKLVHANTNKNKDKFLNHELLNAQSTPILKLVNWNHKEPNIGVIYASRYIESINPEEDDYLECFCAISKLKYESYAKEIIKRYNAGTLSFSMETFFAKAECSHCQQMFDGPETSYCNHLRGRFSSGSKVARILHGLVFAGCAVADTPADVNAEALAMASNQNKEVDIVSDKTYTQAEVDSIVQDAIAKALKASELSTENEGLKTRLDELTQAVSELSDNLGKANEGLKAAETSVASLTTEKETLAKEYNEFKTTVQRTELVRARIAELTSAGYTIPASDTDEYKTLESSLATIDESGFTLIKTLSSKLKESAAASAETTSTDANTTSESDQDDETPPLTGVAQASNDDESRRELIRSIFGRKN